MVTLATTRLGQNNKKAANRARKKEAVRPGHECGEHQARIGRVPCQARTVHQQPQPSPSKVTVVSDTESVAKPGQPEQASPAGGSDVIDLSPDSPT